MTDVSFDLDDDTLALLRQVALREGRTELDVVQRAVQDYAARLRVRQRAREISAELEEQYRATLEGLARSEAEDRTAQGDEDAGGS